MIAGIIKKWDSKKHLLENYFKDTRQEEYDSYEKIVRKLFEIVINSDGYVWGNYDVDKLTVLDHGDYQGSLIFIIPKKSYQPSAEDYLVTNTYYGSCSGCDTLQSIHNYDDGLPNEGQVKEYMKLSLHLVQRLKTLGEE